VGDVVTTEAAAMVSRGRRITIELWPSAHRFKSGHRVRLQVSSGSHPRYVRNLGSGEPVATTTRCRVADHELSHDPDRPSAIALPVHRST